MGQLNLTTTGKVIHEKNDWQIQKDFNVDKNI